MSLLFYNYRIEIFGVCLSYLELDWFGKVAISKSPVAKQARSGPQEPFIRTVCWQSCWGRHEAARSKEERVSRSLIDKSVFLF